MNMAYSLVEFPHCSSNSHKCTPGRGRTRERLQGFSGWFEVFTCLCTFQLISTLNPNGGMLLQTVVLRQWRFRLDIRKNFFTKRVIKHRGRLPGDIAGSPSPEVFKRRVDVALRDMV